MSDFVLGMLFGGGIFLISVSLGYLCSTRGHR